MSKILQLLSILPHRPLEVFDRLTAVADAKIDRLFRRVPSYSVTEWAVAIGVLSQALGDDLSVYLAEPAIKDIERTILKTTTTMPPDAPFRFTHNGDLRLATLAYALCRATRPNVVLETGTCYGVTTSFILKALRVNGSGALHSIDLPPLGKSADEFVGYAVPNELKDRWTLHRGTSRRIMPKLLHALDRVDFFLHDSLHTYGNILRECDLAFRHLSRRGVFVVDDVEGNSAFRDWVDRSRPDCAVVIREVDKPALFGAGFYKCGRVFTNHSA